VRSLLVMLVLVLALAPAAHAEPEPFAWPARMRGVYVGGGATSLGERSVGGVEAAVDHGLGRGRWQLVPEAALRWLPPDGWQVRVGATTRWLARSFRPDARSAIDLYLDISPGAELITGAGSQVVRPDLRLGWGIQIRDGWKSAIRLGMRFSLAPAPASAAIVCRGACAADRGPVIDDGIQVLLGVAW
jgi:hypothetical protein